MRQRFSIFQKEKLDATATAWERAELKKNVKSLGYEVMRKFRSDLRSSAVNGDNVIVSSLTRFRSVGCEIVGRKRRASRERTDPAAGVRSRLGSAKGAETQSREDADAGD